MPTHDEFWNAAVWTNVFLIVPTIMAFLVGFEWLGMYLILMFWASSIYHVLRLRPLSLLYVWFSVLDLILAFFLAVFNVGMITMAPGFGWTGFATLCIFTGALVAFRVQYRNHESHYASYHGAWHFLGAAGTSLSILLYVGLI